MHRGMCLGFDVPRELVQVVRYVRHIHVIGELTAFSQKQTHAIIDRLNLSKYKGWSYEREVRARAKRQEQDLKPDYILWRSMKT